MNPDKTAIIKYSQEFVTPYGTKVWVGLEKPMIQSADEDLQFQTIMQQVRQWGEQATQTEFKFHRILNETPEIPQEERLRLLEIDILAETCLRGPDGKGGLLSWNKVVAANPSLQPAYDKRMKELQGE